MAVVPGAFVLHVSDINRAAAFWSEALDYVADPENPAFLTPRNGAGPRLHLDEDDRTHLDLHVDRDGSDVDAEVERLVALGATRVDWVYPPDAEFVVLADTDGNLFCVIP
jgi:catechol 2,3-dioxygenase-like lactoylglutathione lyase family enzyme